MNLIPMIVDKEINGERSYDIFSKLLKNRIIILSGTINDESANTGFKHLWNIKTPETIEKWLFFCQIFILYLAYNARTMI